MLNSLTHSTISHHLQHVHVRDIVLRMHDVPILYNIITVSIKSLTGVNSDSSNRCSVYHDSSHIMQFWVQLPTSSYIIYICTLTNILLTVQKYMVDTHLELFQCTLEWGDKVKAQSLWCDLHVVNVSLWNHLQPTCSQGLIPSLHAVRVSFPVYMQPGSHSQSACSQGLIPSLHAVEVSFLVCMQPGSHSQSTCSRGLIPSLHAVRVSFPVCIQPGSHSQSAYSQGLIPSLHAARVSFPVYMQSRSHLHTALFQVFATSGYKSENRVIQSNCKKI